MQVFRHATRFNANAQAQCFTGPAALEDEDDDAEEKGAEQLLTARRTSAWSRRRAPATTVGDIAVEMEELGRLATPGDGSPSKRLPRFAEGPDEDEPAVESLATEDDGWGRFPPT
jgi:hypothetical protein